MDYRLIVNSQCNLLLDRPKLDQVQRQRQGLPHAVMRRHKLRCRRRIGRQGLPLRPPVQQRQNNRLERVHRLTLVVHLILYFHQYETRLRTWHMPRRVRVDLQPRLELGVLGLEPQHLRPRLLQIPDHLPQDGCMDFVVPPTDSACQSRRSIRHISTRTSTDPQQLPHQLLHSLRRHNTFPQMLIFDLLVLLRRHRYQFWLDTFDLAAMHGCFRTVDARTAGVHPIDSHVVDLLPHLLRLFQSADEIRLRPLSRKSTDTTLLLELHLGQLLVGLLRRLWLLGTCHRKARPVHTNH